MSPLTWALENYRKRTNHFLKFLLVGILNTFVGLLVIFILLNLFNQSYWISTFIGNCTGAFVSYLLNKKFTFGSKVSHIKGSLRFIVIVLSCYVFSYYSSYNIAVWLLNLRPIGNLISYDELAVLGGTAIYTVTNYFGQKYIVFKEKPLLG